jgi:hypothetical protein
VTDEDFRRQYEADIARLAALLAAPKVVPPVVYAVVVVGPVDRLRAAAARPEVRLVDVGAGATAPGAGDAVGLRPEETAQAGKPPTRPA